MRSCIIVFKLFVSVFNKEKKHFVTFHGDGCKEKIGHFINSKDAVDSNYHWKKLKRLDEY